MAEKPAAKPALQKPPGYRNPAGPPLKPPPIRRPAQLPPSFRYPGKPVPRRRRSGRAFCRRLCCWLILGSLGLALAGALAGALAYLWYQPRLPSFRLQSVNATRLRVAAAAAGGGGASTMDAVMAVRLYAWNPNGKIELEYGDGKGSVAAEDQDSEVELGSAAVSGFLQGRRNATEVGFEAAARGVVVDDAVGIRMRARYRSREMRVKVVVDTRVGLVVSGMSTAKMPIRVECDPVSLQQATAGGADLHRCRVYMFGWFNLN